MGSLRKLLESVLKFKFIQLRNKKNIIPSISVTDIVFDDYLGNGIIELFPK
jgi:hypothetical protein